MWLRPWHVIVCVVTRGVVLTGRAFAAGHYSSSRQALRWSISLRRWRLAAS
jgi:hypothetical protein